MASIFTKIIQGEIPARFVFQDNQCVAFLSIAPLKPGHTLIVPKLEVDHFIDLPVSLFQHLTHVSQRIAKALAQAFPCNKVGMMIAGLEVPHVHIHLVPMKEATDLEFKNANSHPNPKELDNAAEKIRTTLQQMVLQENG